LFAVAATVGLVLFALGPGAATAAAQTAGNDSLDVSVSQAGNAGSTVTVTDNDTAVENASVAVDALDNVSYAGTGNYTTDVNGTVPLPAPEQNVTIEVTATAGNATVSTTAELTVAAENETGSFGDRVSAFVESLRDGNSTNIGPQVAEFVTENNPGNAPDHAGPPADDDRRGPPADVGPQDDDDNETDQRRGPPADAGPQDDDNETDEDKRRGPPEDRGNDADDDSDTNGGGPPEQARGNAGGN
jgi:hypothetical protein